MDPALAQKPEHRRALGHVIAGLAGELGAEAVGGEFGLAAGGGVALSRVAQVPVGDLVPGEQGELVGGQPGGRAAGEGDVAGAALAVDAAAGAEGKAGQAGALAAVRVVHPAEWPAGPGDAQRNGLVIGGQHARPQDRRNKG